MRGRRWFLPLGLCSPTAHTPGPDWWSVCGLWDLTWPGVIEDDIPRPKCSACLAHVEAGGSHASGGDVGGLAPLPARNPRGRLMRTYRVFCRDCQFTRQFSYRDNAEA